MNNSNTVLTTSLNTKACQADKDLFSTNLFNIVSSVEKSGIASLACLAILNGFNTSVAVTSKAVAQALKLDGINTQTKEGKGACLSRVTAYIKLFPSATTELFLKTIVTAYVDDKGNNIDLFDLADHVAAKLESKGYQWSSEKRDFKTLSADKVTDETENTETETGADETINNANEALAALVYTESDFELSLAAIRSISLDMVSGNAKDNKGRAQLIGKICENMLGDKVATTEQIQALIQKVA